MPIYEYRCSKCAHVFEEWAQHFDSPTAEPCPKCGGEAHRIMSNTSFLLKGGGWYATEYGSLKGKSDEGPASGPAAPKPAAESQTKAAPAPKTPPAQPAPQSTTA